MNKNNIDEMTNEELIALYRSSNDEYVKEYFFEQNLDLVYYIANRYINTSKNRKRKDEIFSEAMIGLVKAFNKFDETKGFKFVSYAGMSIQNSILLLFRTWRRQDRLMTFSINDDVPGTEDITYEHLLAADNFTNDSFVIVKDILNKFNNESTEREKKVYYLLMNKGLTQMEVAEKVGIRQSSVSRIEKRIKEKMQ